MKKLIILFTAVLGLIGTGCKKGFLDINTNPNQSTSASPELVLPAALQGTAARFDNPIGGNANFSFIAGWMGYIAISGSYAISNNDFTTYQQTSGFGEGIWQLIYDNLADYDYVEKQSNTTAKPFFEGAAKIMKAYNFAALVDLFNNIPYSEALQGTANIHPKYDDAATIYGDLLKQITAGMTLIKNAPTVGDAKSDIMFAKVAGADLASIKLNWQQFGNSLKLRMLLQMSEMPTKPSYFNTELATVAASPVGFLTIDATVNPGYLNTAGKLNPFYGSNYSATGTYTNDFWRANAYAIKWYDSTNDPRKARVYSPISGGAFVGNTLGVAGAVGSASSTFGPGVLQSFSQDAVLMLAAESYFEQSEAALRGWITGSAQALYEQGVAESFRYLGLSGAQASAYVAQTTNQLPKQTTWSQTTTMDEKLELIIKQKWAAENMINVLVPYNDYRRFINTSRSPKPLSELPLSLSPAVDIKAIPWRIVYPSSENATNAGNVPQLSGTYPHHTNKIFWMP